jgi:antitoxin component YwqK of YwqJK toxin-antitoxin module
MINKLKSITNIPFIVCLIILLVNDFYFKTEYHNWLTGKLSDFCGLFIFASLWTAIIPNKKRIIYFSTALLFILWKSPYSQPFIDNFSHYLYPIQRVVDITDLIALLILPIAFFYRQEKLIRLNPIPLALLTLFSFCATSMPEYTQKFEQPQYLLFQSGIQEVEKSEFPNDYQVYEQDSLIIISVREIKINQKASINDDYHKVQILKNLDLNFLQQLRSGYLLKGELSDYKELLDSLTVKESTKIIVKSESFTDYLKFKGTRLQGSFKRFSNNELIIKGQFKNGIEDSLWTFYNAQNELILKKYFRNGELIKTQEIEKQKVKSETNFNTRNDIIRNKYFHISFLIILILGFLTKLFLNFKKTEQKDIFKTSHFFKITNSVVLPLIILFFAKILSSIIPYSYTTEFLGIFGEAIFVYLVTTPVLLIIFYLIKLRTKFDLLYYTIILALGIVLIEEWMYINSLI